jgi:hypothetical protein
MMLNLYHTIVFDVLMINKNNCHEIVLSLSWYGNCIAL